VLCEPCPTCHGRGELKTAQTICYEILREILREAKQFNARGFRILAAQPSSICSSTRSRSRSPSWVISSANPSRCRSKSIYTQEQYDIVLI